MVIFATVSDVTLRYVLMAFPSSNSPVQDGFKLKTFFYTDWLPILACAFMFHTYLFWVASRIHHRLRKHYKSINMKSSPLQSTTNNDAVEGELGQEGLKRKIGRYETLLRYTWVTYAVILGSLGSLCGFVWIAFDRRLEGIKSGQIIFAIEQSVTIALFCVCWSQAAKLHQR